MSMRRRKRSGVRAAAVGAPARVAVASCCRRGAGAALLAVAAARRCSSSRALQVADARARVRATRAGIAEVQRAVTAFRAEMGRCPRSTTELVHPPRVGARYLLEVPIDGWGRELYVRCPSPHDPNAAEVVSAGPSGSFSETTTTFCELGRRREKPCVQYEHKQPGNSAQAARSRRSREGMTLIEIMVVMVIMALVATAAGFAILPQLKKAKIKQTQQRRQGDRQRGRAVHVGARQLPDDAGAASSEKILDKNKNTKDGWGNEFTIECDAGRRHGALGRPRRADGHRRRHPVTRVMRSTSAA